MLNINSKGDDPKMNNEKATRDKKTCSSQRVSYLLYIKYVLAPGLCIPEEEGWVLGPLHNMNFPNVSQLQNLLCQITLCWSTVEIHSVQQPLKFLICTFPQRSSVVGAFLAPVLCLGHGISHSLEPDPKFCGTILIIKQGIAICFSICI